MVLVVVVAVPCGWPGDEKNKQQASGAPHPPPSEAAPALPGEGCCTGPSAHRSLAEPPPRAEHAALSHPRAGRVGVVGWRIVCAG